MKNVIAFVTGLIFALGLGISGMLQPQKIVGFLDFFGHWDPALAFVMVGAIAVHSLAYVISRKFKAPVLAGEWNLPTEKAITLPLILGAILFGIGWALGGFCPGPALVSLTSYTWEVIVFVGAMIASMRIYSILKPA